MPSMRSFRGLVARLKSPATKHQQHSTEAACDDTLVSKDQELQRDQDLQRDQNNTSVSSSDPLDAAACQLRSSDPEQQAVALETLWSATCADSVDAATKIHAAGMVPCLTQLLSSPDHRVQVGAAATLGNVLRELPAACTQAAAAGAVPTLIQLLGSDPDDVLLPRYAVGALESIADDAEQGSAGMQAAVEPLVQLLSCDDISTQSRGVGCLWSVMRHDEEAREQAVAAGATQHLVQLLQCAVAICDPALLHRCLMSVGVLSTHPTAQRVLLQRGCIPLLVEMLASVPHAVLQQLAVGVLHNCVATNWAVAEAVVAAQPAPHLVSLLASDEVTLRRTAVALLELIADAVAAFRADVLAAGAVPTLVQLVRSCEDEETQQRAAGLLWTLAADVEGRAAITEAGGVQALERLRCDREDPDVIKVATGALQALRQVEETCQQGSAAPEEVSLAQRVAELSSSDPAVRRNALYDLAVRTGPDPSASIAIRSEGGVPRIVQLLQDGDAQTQRYAAALLGNMLADDQEECSTQAVAEGAVQPLITMLGCQDDPLKQSYASGALVGLAGLAVEVRPQLRREAVQLLVALLGSEETTTQLRACTCLALLAYQHMPTYVAMRRAGAVPLLVAQLSSSEATVVERAAAVLGSLVSEDIPSRSLAVEAGAVPVLVDHLCHDNEDVQQYAAGCLLCIVETSGRGRVAALQAGVVEQLTHLADTSSDSEASRRARAALQYLKVSW